MPEGSETSVLVCPSCSFEHKVRAEMAGKRAKCKCGSILQIPIPAVAVEPPAEDLYDIAETPAPAMRRSAYEPDPEVQEEMDVAPVEPVAPVKKARAASAPTPEDDKVAAAAAAAALARGYMPKHKQVETEDENPPPEPSVFLDTILPVVLIPAGVLLCFVQAMYFDKGSPKTFPIIAGPTIVSMVASLGLVVAAVLGAGAALGMVFIGSMGQTIMKICAIALIPATVGAMVDHSVDGINGNILSVFTAIGLYLLLTKLILRQQWQDTGIIVFALWTIRAIVMYAMYKIQSAQMGSAL